MPAPERTLSHLLDLRAAEEPARPFVEVDGVLLTLGQMRARTAQRASALATAGVAPGDRLAVMCRNRLELVELFFACAWSGAVFAPINVAARGPQLEHILDNLAPKALAGERDLLGVLTGLSLPGSLESIWTLDDLPDSGVEAAPFGARPDDTLTILYTSGTTGPSKGVCCPHAQFYWWGVNTASALGVDEHDVLHTCLPLFHTNALNTLVQSLVTGSRCVIASRFAATSFWSDLATAGATVTYILGAMASILLARNSSEEAEGHSVRVALAPATPPEAWSAFEAQFGVRLVEGHGMTETNLAIGPRDGEQRLGAMGRVMSGFEARVVDEHDKPVPDGTPGELVLRAGDPLAFATGYHMLPDETAQAWRGGWFHSGDRVVCDDDGYFRFLDRMKDAIRRRGENVSAWEVEQVVGSHPGVAAAAAVGVPSELGEDEVMIFVIPRRPGLDPVDLLRHCEPRLAYFAIPRFVEFVDELPLTSNGKVRKAALRERGVSARTWDREHAGYEITRLL